MLFSAMNNFLSKVILFLMLSFAAPAVNAMRSIERCNPIAVFDVQSNRRRRTRMFERRYGFAPTPHFSEFAL